MIGYRNMIFMLPFDHRHSFVKEFGFSEKLSKEQRQIISYYKELIYKGFLLARKSVKNKSNLSILVDEYYGLKILKSAKKNKILFAISTEKSGQKYFDFEYGKNFGKYVKKINPTFVKALVRYDLKDKKNNLSQLKKLKSLNDFCKLEKRIFLIELLTPIQKNKASMTSKIIAEFQNFSIDPDIWKIEAYNNKSDWQIIIKQIKNIASRKNVGIIMLGRGEDISHVKKWIKVAKKIKDINGFAIGRTIFQDALIAFHKGKITEKQTIQKIANRYLEMINLWEK
jgi:myo-inositol catabolism protein IolC